MDKEEQEEQRWTRALVIFCRLTKIDREAKEITVVYNDEDTDGDWVTETYNTPNFDDDDFETLFDYLDEQIKIYTKDSEVIEWSGI
jgi:hypothetical protein